MEEKDIYQGLTKSQITKFKKEESACSSHWDFLSFSEKLLEVGATIWLKKTCLEQFKKEDYGIDMRKWISKLISINEIEAAEDLLKKAEKKVNDFNGYRELAELSCSTADFKNNYAKKLYNKALEKAGDGDFLSFSEKLLEVGATIWLKKTCLEQFKKEDYGIDMRKWISKLISINEIEAAEDLLKKAEKKVNDFNGYRELAELSCSTADFKNNYAKKLYDKALEKAGDDMYDLEALIVSVSDKNYLNDNKYTKNVVKIAVENCIDLAAVVSLIKLLKENSTDASVIDVLVTKGQQFCVAIKTMHSEAYENPEECTMDDFLAFIENISDKNEIHKLLTSCIDKVNEDIFQFIPIAEYYHKIEDSKKCYQMPRTSY